MSFGTTVSSADAILTQDNYKQGCLTTEKFMIGVTVLDNGKYAAFSLEVDTGIPVEYSEFVDLRSALKYANAEIIDRGKLSGHCHYEAFGCDKGSSCKGAQKGACSSCSHSTHSC